MMSGTDSRSRAATPLLERLAACRTAFAERPAFITADGAVSYDAFYRRVAGIRAQLIEVSARLGSSPVIAVEAQSDSVATYAAIVAIWSVGAAYVPLSLDMPRERLMSVTEQVGAKIVITQSDAAEFDSLHRIDVRDLPTADASDEPWEEGVAGGDLAYVLFTSGSTGVPKGVPIRVANLEAFLDATMAVPEFQFGPDDRFLQMFDLSFDLSVMCYLVPLTIGATVCLVPQAGVFYLNVLKTLRDSKVSVALMVPSVLVYAQKFLARLHFPDLRCSLFCGEALVGEHVKGWARCLPTTTTIHNLYGPTEATIYCLRQQCDPEDLVCSDADIISIGRPIEHMDARILSGEGQGLPAYEVGELVLSGRQLMDGYWNNEAKTSEVLKNGEYLTGDLAYQDADGRFFYVGRKDHQVKIDGHRIELGEIEHAARRVLGEASNAVAVAKELEGGITRIVLFVSNVGANSRESLQRGLSELIPYYMRPEQIVVLDEFPLSISGKVDRKALAMQPLSTWSDGPW